MLVMTFAGMNCQAALLSWLLYKKKNKHEEKPIIIIKLLFWLMQQVYARSNIFEVSVPSMGAIYFYLNGILPLQVLVISIHIYTFTGHLSSSTSDYSTSSKFPRNWTTTLLLSNTYIKRILTSTLLYLMLYYAYDLTYFRTFANLY